MGVVISTLIFSGGSALGLTGWQAMAIFYVIAVCITLLTAMIKDHEIPDYMH